VKTAPAPKSAAGPKSTARVGTLDTLGLAVYERADGTFFYNDDGRVDVHGNTKWTREDGVTMKGQRPISIEQAFDDGAMLDLSMGDFEAGDFDDVMDRGKKDMPVGRLDGKRGLVYLDQRFEQLYIKRKGQKCLLPMGVKWTMFEDIADAVAKPEVKPKYSTAKPEAQPAKPKPCADKENAGGGATNFAGGKKMALVVGISKYRSCPLKNPVNDAKAIAAKLKSMGFAVTILLDCTDAAMSKAVRGFTEVLSKDVTSAVFFFAGHGCEYQNQNYLMTTTECPDERDLPKKAVSAHEVQRDMEASGCLFPVLILDCCRVFEGMSRGTRAPPKGMAEMVPKGSYVALACAPNTCAEDGTGVNGTFTAALLKHIGTPNKDIDFILSDVRADVEAETAGRQRPWSNHQLKKRPACLF